MSKGTTKAATNKASATNKAKYKVKNWKEYNRSLVNRGSIEPSKKFIRNGDDEV